MTDERGTKGGYWAVLDYDDNLLDGRLWTDHEAIDEGLAGRYLLSGHEVIDTRLCNAQMRDGRCAMDAGHKGRCTTVAFECDTCGKRRRGQPVAELRNPWDDVVEAVQCWFCQQVMAPIWDRQAFDEEMRTLDAWAKADEAEVQGHLSS